MYTRTFPIGRPIAGFPLLSLPHSYIVAHTVVSVGPYALISRLPPPHLSTISSLTAPPATIITPTSSPHPSPTVPNTAGGSVACVIPSLLTTSTSPSPINSPLSPVTYNVPPPHSAISTSDIL